MSNSSSSFGGFPVVTAFARLRRGGDPVLGARVRMEVEVETEGEDKEPVRMAPVDMLDDGYGGEDFGNLLIRIRI